MNELDSILKSPKLVPVAVGAGAVYMFLAKPILIFAVIGGYLYLTNKDRINSFVQDNITTP